MIRSIGRFERGWVAVLIAILLAIRLITPTGFMPTFEHGAVTVIACPEFGSGLGVPNSHKHNGQHEKARPACPYAAASSSASPGIAIAVAAPVAGASAASVGERSSGFSPRRSRDRPPSRGPPLVA
jgi:hypothetical protein